MVLCQKMVDCSTPVGSQSLDKVKDFQYHGVLFMSEVKMERQVDRRTGAASAAMQTFYRTIVVKRELIRKAKFSIYWLVYVPTLTYSYGLWVVTKTRRLRTQASEMSFPHVVAGLSLRDRVWNSDIRRELRIERLLLHIITLSKGDS